MQKLNYVMDNDLLEKKCQPTQANISKSQQQVLAMQVKIVVYQIGLHWI